MKKILLTFILGILLVGTVSAMEVDNFKIIDSKYEVTIKNVFGLGEDLGRIKLVNYNQYCFVGDCYAYYQLDHKENDISFKGSKYYNIGQTRELNNKISNYEIYNENFEYDVDKYTKVCETLYSNSTTYESCVDKKDGTEKRYGKFIPYNLNTKLPSGNYLLREKVDVRYGETVDVVPNFYGVDINEWALFTGYERFEELNFTGFDAEEASTNEQANAQTFTIGEVGANQTLKLKGISLVLRVSSGDGDNGFIHISELNESGQPSKIIASNNSFGSVIGGAFTNYNITLPGDEILIAGQKYAWVIGMTDGSAIRVQVNYSSLYDGGGTLVNSSTKTWGVESTTNDMQFIIWGTNFTEVGINTELNSPSNNTIISRNSQEFNATSVIINGEMTNMTLYLWDSDGNLLDTNTSIVTGTTNSTGIFYSGFDDSLPKQWNILTCATNSTSTLCDFADNNRTFTPNIFNFGFCNSTLNQTYINFTFKDEGDDSDLYASIPNADFVYYLDDISVNKTFNFINNTANPSYGFCFSLVSETVNLAMSVQYKNTTGYPQRTFTSIQSLTNNTKNQTLYLLGSADGLFVTFQVINQAEQPISGVKVNSTRVIGGESVIVGDGFTGAAGSVTFWLNPDFSHTTVFQKTGFDLFTFVTAPTQSVYTITLGGEVTPSIDLRRGIAFSSQPTSEYLINDTEYYFNFTISSSFWSLDSYGFSLYYGNGSLIGSVSDTIDTGGTVNLASVDTSNQSAISMNYFWVINSTRLNGTRVWVIDSTTGRDFSLFRLFTDLNLYIDAGLFGLDGFGKALLSLTIMIMVAGGVSARYGVRSEAAVMGILFGVVLFLDVGIGLIPTPELFGITPKENLITIITGAILVGTIVREELR